jgi:hypothetical protein
MDNREGPFTVADVDQHVIVAPGPPDNPYAVKMSK